MKHYNLDFAMFVGGLPFNGETIPSGESLGGSETAAIQLSEELARQGSRVQIFCNCNEPSSKSGVKYVPVGWAPSAGGGSFPKGFFDYIRSTPTDVCVVQRMPAMFQFGTESKVNLLWQHDLATKTGPSQFHPFLWNIDKVLVLSGFMKEQYKSVHGGVDSIYHVTRNGIDLDLISEAASQPRDRFKMMFTARPERGLDIMLRAVLPKILNREPRAKLYISRYKDPSAMPIYAQLEAEMKQYGDRIEFLGNLGKKALYEHYKSARIYLYPSMFEEISPLRGDSVIDMPGGRETIENLWRQQRKDFWVWSYNGEEMVLAKARRVVQTRINAPMLTITMKPKTGCRARCETTLTLTPDHELMLRDGTYRRADQLLPGDTLMPFGRTPGFGRFKRRGGQESKYWYISRSNLADRVPEHRYVAELMLGRKLGRSEIVDHIDGNTSNNDPDNLQVWSNHSEHQKDHWHRLFEDERQQRIAERIAGIHAYHASLNAEEMHEVKRRAALIGWEQRREENHVVVSLEPAEAADAYCMEVEDTHNFVANGIIVHNCITAMEVAACGAVFLGPWRAALPETIGSFAPLVRDDGSLGYTSEEAEKGLKPPTGKFIDGIVEQALKLMHDDQYWATWQRKSLERARSFDWKPVAEEWISLAHEIIAGKSANGKRMMTHLLTHSDVTAAKKYAALHPEDPSLKRSVDQYIDRFVPFMSETIPADLRPTISQFYEQRSGGANARWETGFFADAEPRLQMLKNFLRPKIESGEIKTILDFGCAHGGYARSITNDFPQVTVVGIDNSASLIRCANEMKTAKSIDGTSVCKYPSNLWFKVGDEDTSITFEDAPSLAKSANDDDIEQPIVFDCVVAMEVLEHVPDSEKMAEKLESMCRVGGWTIFTVPHGRRERDEFVNKNVFPVHVRSFDMHDLRDLFGKKVDFKVISFSDLQELALDRSFSGWFMVSYKTDHEPVGELDYERKFFLQAPRETLCVSMIAHNSEAIMHRALRSVIKLAEQVIVVDNGPSLDRTTEVASEYTKDVRAGTNPFWCYAHGMIHPPELIDSAQCQMAGFETPRNESTEGVWADWCFAPGTQIRTKTGYKNIETIELGDEVLTHKGRFRKVTRLHKNHFDGDLVEMKTSYCARLLLMTPEHPVLATKNFKCYIHNKLCFPQCQRQWAYYRKSPRAMRRTPAEGFRAVENCQQGYQHYKLNWTKAGELQKRDIVVYQPELPEKITIPRIDLAEWVNDRFEYVISDTTMCPRNPNGTMVPRFIAPDESFWRLCGYYLAEGFYSDNNHTSVFAFHRKETEFHDDVESAMEHHFGLRGWKVFPESSLGMHISFASKIVGQFFANFLGNGADNKHLPSEISNLPGLDAFQVFLGWLRGDGSMHPDHFQVVSNSRLLIYQMRDMLLRFGILSSVGQHNGPNEKAWNIKIGGHGLSSLEALGLKHSFIDERTYEMGNQDGWTDGKRMYLAVRDVSQQKYTGLVYNLTVDEDNSYIAEDVTVHNCLWLDCDEQLLDAGNLPKYLRSNAYIGYAIQQHHISIDPPSAIKKDIPVRLYRNIPEMRFYGLVHEHAELGVNRGIGPMVTVLSDVNIHHDGYLVESIRRGRFRRNLKLLECDRRKYPERLLGIFLYEIRDCMHMARYEMEQNGGMMTENVHRWCQATIAAFRQHFMREGHMLANDALSYYSQALQILNQGIEVAVDVDVQRNNANPKGQPLRFRAMDTEEANIIIKTKLNALASQCAGPYFQ